MAPTVSSPYHILKVSKAQITQFGEITFLLLNESGKEMARTTQTIS
jgi:hypothetical protein